jgi:hypothetical protein
MNEELKELFKQYIKDNLKIDVTSDCYYNCGGSDGQMYTKYYSITLYLEDEAISSISLDCYAGS